MKIVWRALIGVLVLAAVLVAGALIYVSRMDPARYNELVSAAVRDATGRELDSAGGLRLKLFPQISLEASEVTFSNAAWASQKDMVRVGRVRAELAWLPLLSGRLRLHEIVIVEPEIFLETDAGGRGNWLLARPGKARAPAGAAAGAGVSGLRLDVSRVHVEQASIRYRDGASGRTVGVRVDQLSVTRERAGGDMAVAIGGRYQGLDVSVEGTVGALETILANQKTVLELSATAGDARLAVSGSIGEPLRAQGLDLAIVGEVPATRPFTDLAALEIRELGPLTFRGRLVEQGGRLDLDAVEVSARSPDVTLDLRGTVTGLRDEPRPDLVLNAKAESLRHLLPTLPPAGPVEVSARVEPRGEVIEVKTLEAKVGASELAGSLKVALGGERPRATGKLHAPSLNLDELAPGTPRAAQADAAASAGERRIFPDDPIALDVLGAADADLQLTAAHVLARGLDIEDVSISLALDDRRLSVKPRLGLAGGRVAGTLGLDGRQSPSRLSLRLDGEAVKAGTLTEAFREEVLVEGAPMDFHIDVRGSGASLRDIMAGLDGRIRLHIGKGKLRGDSIDLAGGDVMSQLLGNVIPHGDEDANVLQCGVVHFEVRDGFAVADQSLVLETNKVLVKGGGAVDLASETLDLGARMAARSGLRLGAGTLASLMRIGGTLANPRLGVDLKGTVETGARVTGAVLTMGLSLVAENVYGELKGDPHPCESARQREFEPRRRGEHEGLDALPAAKKVTEGARDVTRATGKAVEETAKESGKLLERIGSGIKKLVE